MIADHSGNDLAVRPPIPYYMPLMRPTTSVCVRSTGHCCECGAATTFCRFSVDGGPRLWVQASFGVTETYGPATPAVFHAEWNALPARRAFAKMARVRASAYPMVERFTVADPQGQWSRAARVDKYVGETW